MRPKTMILFVIAVGCGLVASIGVSQYMESGSANVVATDQIFVAVSDINIGETLGAENVKLEEWPRDRVPEGAVRNLEDLEDRFPRTRLYSGEPILQAKLMDSRDRGSPALTIPKGFRVVAVKVTTESSVSGLVQPGDRVDLLVFLRKSPEVPETGTKTILRDVNVFGVDGETERSTDEDTGQVRNLRTVSLLVKPEQAVAVNLAAELGTLSLSLRRPDDDTQTVADEVSVHSLLGTAPESANTKPTQSSQTGPGFTKWLTDQVARSTVESTPSEDEPAWEMELLGPQGVKAFQWHDLQQLPVLHIDRPASASESATSADGAEKPEASLQEETEQEGGAADSDAAPGNEEDAA